MALFSVASRKFSYLKLVVVVALTLGHASQSVANPVEEYLTGVTGRLTELQEHLYFEFSDLALKRHCPGQYDAIQTYLYELNREYPRITLTELLNERESALAELWSACEQASVVSHLEYQFNFRVSNMAADLIARVKGLVENDAVEMTFEKRTELAEQIITAEIESNFQPEKVYEQITSEPEVDALVRIKHLAKTKEVLVLDFAQLKEMEAAAARAEALQAAAAHVKEVRKAKKGHCVVCHKKLGLMPFVCKCTLEFCAEHRLPETHACTFDHKEEGRELLRRANPVVIADKIPGRI